MSTTAMMTLEKLITADRAKEHEERKRRHREALHASANIPLRYKMVTLETFEPRTKALASALEVATDYVVNFKAHSEAGRCLIFAGPAGTGKTHLACAIVNSLCNESIRNTNQGPTYRKLIDAIRSLRETWRKDSQKTELEILQSLRSASLLVLDEVGIQYGSDGERVHTFDIIDSRYADMRPSIVISNCEAAALQDYLGDRVLDRLLENGGRMVKFDGPSNRTKKSS